MSYFGTTALNVIKALQGNDYSYSDFINQSNIESIMTRKESDIASRMPDYISQMLYGGTVSGQGLISGHIIVTVASNSQTTSDYALVTGYDENNLDVYLNWPSTWPDNPSVDYTDYLVDSDDWSVSSGIITLTTGMGRGDSLMATYETTWSDGIPSLQNMLIALTVEELIAVNFNEQTQALWAQRIADAKKNLLDMSQDKYIPKEIAVLQLHKDRRVDEIGANFQFQRV